MYMENKALVFGLLLIGLFAAGVYAQGPKGQGQMCAQVITYAENPETGEVIAFPTPCSVPEGWETVPNRPITINQGEPNMGKTGTGQGEGSQYGQGNQYDRSNGNGTNSNNTNEAGRSTDFVRVFVYDAGKPINAAGILIKDGIVADFTMGHVLNLKGEGDYTLMVLAMGYPVTTLEVSAGVYVIDLSNNTTISSDLGDVRACTGMGPKISAEQAKNRVRSKFGEIKEVLGQVRLEFKDCKALYKMRVKRQMRLFGAIPLPFDEEVEVKVDAETGEVN